MPLNTWLWHNLLTYDVFFFAGIVVFFVVFFIESRHFQIKWDDVAILGAIIPFAGMALSHSIKYLAPESVSLSLYAAAIGGIIGGGAYALWRRISLLKIGDAAAPAAALAFAIMKLGCLIGGCCSGVSLFPVQLMVAVLCLAVFALCFVVLPWCRKKAGRRLGVALGIYALGRFVIDFYSSSQLLLGPLSANQIFGIVMIVVSVVLII